MSTGRFAGMRQLPHKVEACSCCGPECSPATCECESSAKVEVKPAKAVTVASEPKQPPDHEGAAMRGQTVNRQPHISVIIPTLNEAQALPRALASVNGAGATEVIVVDGGSHDATVSIARAHGCRVVQAPAGRGSQLHAGAAVARGEVFLFLHADCILLPGSLEEIQRVLVERPAVVAGGFSLCHGSRRLDLRLVDIVGNLRARLTRIPWGDQGIFVRREAYNDVGGFRPYPLLEDQDLCQRLQQLGDLIILRQQILASPRRLLAHGFGMTLVRAICIVGLYHLGVSPHRLVHLW